MEDDAPEVLRVMRGVTIEDGVVTEHTFGETFQSDPSRAFGPLYVHKDVADKDRAYWDQLYDALERVRSDLSKLQRVDFERSISSKVL